MCIACEMAFFDMVEAMTPEARETIPARAGGGRALCLRRAAPPRRRQPAEDRAQAVSELTSLTLAEARDGLGKKSFSAAELTNAHLAAIEKARALNAYVLETPERAAEMAKASDARIAKGEARPLEGIPLAIKDMFCTEGVRTTACSHILDNFVPTYKSTVSAQAVARRRGAARQDQQRRVRHGLVERDLVFRHR